MGIKSGLPLEGIKILSFAQVGQGPAAVQLLADFGADVIKVERPEVGAWERGFAPGDAMRDGESFFFLAFNRNQRSLTLNLKNEEGKSIVRQLVRDTDVVIENYRPGVMDRLGLGYDALCAENPRLIYASSSGFGEHGPYCDWPGQDLVVQGISGLAAMTGKANDPPTPAGAPVMDLHAGTLLALGICVALLQVARTGKGQWVCTSLLEAAVHLQWEALFYLLNGFHVTERSESGLASPYHPAPYGIYSTKDGYISLSLSPLQQLAEALKLPSLNQYTEGDALPRRDEIKRLIDAVIVTATTEEWLERLRGFDIWCGPVLTYDELLRDPQFKVSGFVVNLRCPGIGDVVHLRPPVRLSAVPSSCLPMEPPPKLGEHTLDILKSLGYTLPDIDILKNRGVI